MSDVLPPIDELLAEFDNGKIPRSETWHTLITGLYFNFDSVNEIENWYNTVLELTSINQQLANDIKLQHDQIEIWYGQIDTWQQQVANNKNEVDSKTAEALASSEAAAQSAKKAEEEADKATATVDKLSDRFETLESNLQQISNPNLLINGDFSVWQRGSFPDRYKIGAGSSASQSTRVANTSPASGAYALKIERLSDDTFYSVIQKIENGVQVCGGQTVSMSMWMKSNKTGTMSFVLKDEAAETNIVISGFTYHTANKWQKIENTADCPKSTGSTLSFYVLQPMYNVCTNVGDWIEVTGVKLEISAAATPFIPDDPATNLAKCQRYYIKIDFGGTRMDQDGYQGTWSLLNIDFPTTMRTTPTIILHGNGLAESNSAFLSPGGITLRAHRSSTGAGVTGYEASAEL